MLTERACPPTSKSDWLVGHVTVAKRATSRKGCLESLEMWELERSLWVIASQHRLAARGLTKGKLLNGGQMHVG